MRGALIALWLLIPFGILAYHYGPGQERLVLDRTDLAFGEAARLSAQAERTRDSHTALSAVELWDEGLQALGSLPSTPERLAATRRARLERAKVGMLASKLPEAREELIGLLEEVQGDAKADPAFVTEVRTAVAQAQFYWTWLLKLEGHGREVWEPEIEEARQHYSLLAEAATNPVEQLQRKGDLEAAVRLQLMDPEELRGLAIPDQ